MYNIALKSKHGKNYQIIKKNYGYTRIKIAQKQRKEESGIKTQSTKAKVYVVNLFELDSKGMAQPTRGWDCKDFSQ